MDLHFASRCGLILQWLESQSASRVVDCKVNNHCSICFEACGSQAFSVAKMAAKVKAILARLDWRRIFAKIFHYLPRVAIYSVCLVLFVANVGQLIANYLRFETIVMVHYEEETSVDFPAFTICGCCLQRPIIDQSPTILLNNELEILKSYPVREVFENQTYKYNNLVSKCYYVHDSKNPDHKIECHVLQSVVESIHDGRKCFTFLSHLVNNPNSGMLDFLQTNEKKRRIISYIQIELNLKGYKLVDKEYPIRNELLNADVIMSMHPNKQIPNMLDAEFFQIEPRKLYEVRFIKEKTILLPKTFNSDCRYYDKRSSEFNHQPYSENNDRDQIIFATL